MLSFLPFCFFPFPQHVDIVTVGSMCERITRENMVMRGATHHRFTEYHIWTVKQIWSLVIQYHYTAKVELFSSHASITITI